MSNILVLGAGELGTSILRALSSQRQSHPEIISSITVFIRHPSDPVPASKQAQLQEFQDLSIKVVHGDIASDSTEQLAEKFKEYDTVVCCTGFVGGKGTQVKITQAVLHAEVKRYVPWQFGVDYDLIGRGSGQDVWDEQLDVRDLLRSQSTTSWIIISTGMFTSFLFEPAFGVVQLAKDKKPSSVVRALGSWDNRITFTTVEDIGHLTSLILVQQPPIANSVVFIAGDTISFEELVSVIESVSGKAVTRQLLDLEKLEKAVEEKPEDGMAKYRLAFGKGVGVAWDMDGTFNARKKIEVVGVEGWARKNLRT